MKKTIAVLPGDGIGPEVVEQAVKTLEGLAQHFGYTFDLQFADVGAIAIERHGDPLPEKTLDICRNADAVLLGAIGEPEYDLDPNAKVRPEQGLLKLRKELGLFANIRPVAIFPGLRHLSPIKEEIVKGVDLLILRELTGGIYFGEKTKKENYASDLCGYHAHEIDRIARLAFEYAGSRRKKVTLVDKANVLESSRLWRKVVREIAKEYPDIALDFFYVDNAAMQLIQNPSQFDVMLTSNMFGDILSDEASVLTGSMGLLPSASIGTGCSLYEPIHGSYPQAAKKDIANPMATILSVEMMLRDFDLLDHAKSIRTAITHLLSKGIGTPDLKPAITHSCSKIGDLIAYLVTVDKEDFHVNEDKIDQNLSTII